MPTLLELATELVRAHASRTSMTPQELLAEIQEVYGALQALEKGQAIPSTVAPILPSAETPKAEPVVSKRKAFGKDKVFCMICGKGMKTLARHLGTEHGLKPGEYRKQFNIPRSQSLAAANYSESRRQMARERGLGENLAKARQAKAGAKATGGEKKPKKTSARKSTEAPAS